jgi:hypothetical protein
MRNANSILAGDQKVKRQFGRLLCACEGKRNEHDVWLWTEVVRFSVGCVARSCVHGNEASVSVKGGKCLKSSE